MHITVRRTYTSTKQASPTAAIVIGILFALIGIGLLIFGFYSIKTHAEKSERYLPVSSIVVDYDYNSDGLQAIIVEYYVDGQMYTKKSNTYSNMPSPIGSEVPLKYNPDDPRDAIWVNDSTNVILPIMGGIFTLVGFAATIAGFKQKRKEKEEQVTVQPPTQNQMTNPTQPTNEPITLDNNNNQTL